MHLHQGFSDGVAYFKFHLRKQLWFTLIMYQCAFEENFFTVKVRVSLFQKSLLKNVEIGTYISTSIWQVGTFLSFTYPTRKELKHTHAHTHSQMHTERIVLEKGILLKSVSTSYADSCRKKLIVFIFTLFFIFIFP